MIGGALRGLRPSVLRDNVITQPSAERTITITQSGTLNGLVDNLAGQVQSILSGQLGGAAAERRLFQQTEITSGTAVLGGTLSGEVPVTWRTGLCAHLALAAGSCPVRARQVLVSTSFAAAYGVRPGSALSTSYGPMTVTGEYAIPPAAQLTTDYWLTGPCDDFAHELPCQANAAALNGLSRERPDALFTPGSTFSGLDSAVQGSAVVQEVIAPSGVRASDLGTLTAAAVEIQSDPVLQGMLASVVTSIPQLAGTVRAAFATLDVPVFLITCQVLVLAWLLLFLIGTDAAQARAGEVALAKLRGHGRLRTVAFGLSEPLLVFAIAFPAGALAGWAATGGLARLLLRHDTHVGLTGLAVLAAAGATLGGFVATALAARRALVQPVTEQWQHASATAAARGWVLDTILLTAAVAGLAELVIGGYVSSTRAGSLALLVPGLLGLAAAVVTSRLLPAACRLGYGPTRQHGGTALFLAVRHIARRPGGTRTTIVLTAAFALATFAVAAYGIDVRNVNRVALAQTGADTVLDVQAPPGQDLGAIVDRIDPGGGQAAVVDRHIGAASGAVLLAVQPQRYARVARWQPGFLTESPVAVSAAIDPDVPPPFTLPAGTEAVRVQVTGSSGLPRNTALTFWIHEAVSPSGAGRTPVSLGIVQDGWLTAAVSQCPCDVSMVSLDPQVQPGQVTGSVTMSGLLVRTGGGWTPMPGPLTTAAGWRSGAEVPAGCNDAGRLQPAGDGLRWSFGFSGLCSPALSRQDTPDPLPALVASQLNGSTQIFSTEGVDGNQVAIRPVALASAVPGAPAAGVVVDRDFAQRASYFISDALTQEQVWVAPDALAAIKAKLVAAGVTIEDQTSASDTAALLLRQGPALASVLFLAVAAAAVLLAAGAAVLSLYQAGRRRRYEYAALIAGRVSRRSVRSSVLIEQAVVLGFGAVAGVAAGLASAALVLRNLPVFITRPAAPPLLTAPPAAQVLTWLAIALALLAATAAVATTVLVRSVRPELLREVPP